MAGGQARSIGPERNAPRTAETEPAAVSFRYDIRARRRHLWELYRDELAGKGGGAFEVPEIPAWATNNGHCFYLACRDLETRSRIIAHLKANGVLAVFHYLPLHSSPFFKDKHDGRALPECNRWADTLVRLPLYHDLSDGEAREVARLVLEAAGG